jgi:N utilization substance protein B
VKDKNSKGGQKVHLAQRRKARKLIMQAMYQWQMTGADAAEIEAQFRAEYTGKTDWDYFQDVFRNIPPNVTEIDSRMVAYLDREIKSLDPIERALLRMGVYELAHRVDVPYRVVINESVNLAKDFGATESHKYINGILDKVSKDLRSLENT